MVPASWFEPGSSGCFRTFRDARKGPPNPAGIPWPVCCHGFLSGESWDRIKHRIRNPLSRLSPNQHCTQLGLPNDVKTPFSNQAKISSTLGAWKNKVRKKEPSGRETSGPAQLCPAGAHSHNKNAHPVSFIITPGGPPLKSLARLVD